MVKPRTAIVVRIDTAVLARLREEYANTYPAHRLSFNAWVVARLAGE